MDLPYFPIFNYQHLSGVRSIGKEFNRDILVCFRKILLVKIIFSNLTVFRLKKSVLIHFNSTICLQIERLFCLYYSQYFKFYKISATNNLQPTNEGELRAKRFIMGAWLNHMHNTFVRIAAIPIRDTWAGAQTAETGTPWQKSELKKVPHRDLSHLPVILQHLCRDPFKISDQIRTPGSL